MMLTSLNHIDHVAVNKIISRRAGVTQVCDAGITMMYSIAIFMIVKIALAETPACGDVCTPSHSRTTGSRSKQDAKS